jgi:hypothetical protein
MRDRLNTSGRVASKTAIVGPVAAPASRRLGAVAKRSAHRPYGHIEGK